MAQGTRALSLLACLLASLAIAQSAVAGPAPCRAVTHEGNAYTVCEADLRRHSIRLFWKRPDGSPYAYLKALPRTVDSRHSGCIFAANAGMFDPAYKPVGLYIEDGRVPSSAPTPNQARATFT